MLQNGCLSTQFGSALFSLYSQHPLYLQRDNRFLTGCEMAAVQVLRHNKRSQGTTTVPFTVLWCYTKLHTGAISVAPVHYFALPYYNRLSQTVFADILNQCPVFIASTPLPANKGKPMLANRQTAHSDSKSYGSTFPSELIRADAPCAKIRIKS
jgi:hypothetical protein